MTAHHIASGGSAAEVSDEGAYLSSLRLDGIPVLKRGEGSSMTHGGSAVLIPYAGRVRGGEYACGGREYRLPLNKEGNAIHGLVKELRWSLLGKTEDGVRLGTSLLHPGYPTRLECSIEYRLGRAGLSVECEVGNAGELAAPLVVGFHPYFLAGRWSLEHGCAAQRYELENGFFPTGKSEAFDFNGAWYDSGTGFDSLFRCPCDVVLRTDSYSLSISRREMPFLVVYNGKYAEGRSVAVEPYSGAPDAFNNGIGLANVEPKGSFRCGFSLALL